MDAVIGGSQLTRLSILDNARRENVSTPYGEPSGPITIGSVAGRDHTFSDGMSGEPVIHVDFTHPFTDKLRVRLQDAARSAGARAFDGGCYACFNGPRLETAAEIRKFIRDGCDLVGQTLMPEAGLAREVGLPYAALCPIVNHAAGLGDSKLGIVRAELNATRQAAMEQVTHILTRFAAREGGG